MKKSISGFYLEYIANPIFLYSLLLISWLWLIEPETKIKSVHAYILFFVLSLHQLYKIGYKVYLLNQRFKYFIFVYAIPVAGITLGVIGAYISHYS